MKFPNDDLQVAIGPAGAVVLTEETTDHDRWQYLIELARDIESAASQK